MVKTGFAIDIDHTLLCTEQFQYKAWQAVLGGSFHLSQEEYSRHYCGRGSKEIAQELAHTLSVDTDIFYNNRMKKLDELVAAQKFFELLPGVRNFFNSIHQNELLYVLVTGGSRHESTEKIKKSELRDIINPQTIMVTKDEYTDSKPHPEPYIIGKEQLKKLPGGDSIEKFIAFEDTVPGMISALKAGYDQVIVIPHIWSRLSFETYEKHHGLPKDAIKLDKIDNYRL